MMNHRQNLRHVRGVGDSGGPARGRPLPDDQPVLPHLRVEGGPASRRSSAARRCCRWPSSTSTASWNSLRPNGSRCCPGRRRCTTRCWRVEDKGKLATLRAGVTGAADIPVELVRRVHDELPFQTLVTGLRPDRGGHRHAVASRRLVRGHRHHRGAAVRRRRGAYRRRRRGAGARLQRHAGLPRRPGRHRRGDRRRRLAAHRRPGHARRDAAGCASSAARRTCSSSAASTPIPPRSRGSCWSIPRSPRPR